jgi:hypothetical protein
VRARPRRTAGSATITVHASTVATRLPPAQRGDVMAVA